MWVEVYGCISLSFFPASVYECVSGCVGGGGGGLMGSVGARVPGEQLSLIIQTRLIIKAAQISPWFHLNCRQAAPLRQAVVTLGRLSLSFSPHLQGLLSPLCSPPPSVLALSQRDGLRLALSMLAYTFNSRKALWNMLFSLYLKMCLIYFWLDTDCALFGHHYGIFGFVGQQRRNLLHDLVGF